MQDQDAPPVEEGETGGGVDVVRAAQTQAVGQAAINSMAEFIPLPWTTAIARRWLAEITVRAYACVPAFRRIILSLIPIHCPSAKTRIPGFLALLTTCSSKPRFRKRPASSTLKLSL